MLRKSQRRLCYFLMCILLMAGIYTTYVKADTFAERVASVEATRIYASGAKNASTVQLRGLDKATTSIAVCIVESINPMCRTAIGRAIYRTSLTRRALQLTCLLLCALCIAYFSLRCCQIEEILCLHEKKYRAALIKYIHDMDGKKRMACLT